MIKRVLTFVSGVQESVLVDFINQNEVKILHKVKTCQNCLHQNFLTKTNKFIFFSIFELLLKFYAQFYLILNFVGLGSTNKSIISLFFSFYLTLVLSSPPCRFLHLSFCLKLSGRSGRNCVLSPPVLSGYNGSPVVSPGARRG